MTRARAVVESVGTSDCPCVSRARVSGNQNRWGDHSWWGNSSRWGHSRWGSSAVVARWRRSPQVCLLAFPRRKLLVVSRSVGRRRISPIGTVGVHFSFLTIRAIIAVASFVSELTVARVVAHIAADSTNNLRHVSPRWLSLVEDLRRNVRLGLSQCSVENSQFSKLVSLEIILPHRRRDGLLDHFIGQLDGLGDLGAGVCGDQYVQVIVRASGSRRIAQLSILDRSFASNGQLRTTIVLELPEGIASGA